MILLVIHAAFTWACVGLIWTVQVAHYPLFAHVARESFLEFHTRHMQLITRVVGPLMLGEIGSAAALLYLGERSWLFVASLGLLGVIWLSTALLQVPLHTRLTLGYDAAVIRRLVNSNWLRTFAWTARGACLGAWLVARS